MTRNRSDSNGRSRSSSGRTTRSRGAARGATARSRSTSTNGRGTRGRAGEVKRAATTRASAQRAGNGNNRSVTARAREGERAAARETVRVRAREGSRAPVSKPVRTPKGENRVRYAIVGLGHIAQNAVLPAFENARGNSELTALISDDREKLRVLSRRYAVGRTFTYEEYDKALESGAFDAVYIALPNHLHHEYAVRALRARRHVLCEKPMALEGKHCREMIEAAEETGARLMVGYRLHFEEANLEAIDIVSSGQIGEPRAFQSLFSMQVKEGDIRLRRETGGGTLWDIGIYCINAARYLFQDEPMAMFAHAYNRGEPRFREVDEMTSAVLHFPEERTATFTTSFGAADVATYTVLGTEGQLRVENAYEYESDIRMTITSGSRTRERRFPRRDQFAPELIYFSECVMNGREPEPSGLEGWIDVEIIRGLLDSADSLKDVEYHGPRRERRPTPEQEIRRKPIERKPELVHTSSPSEE